MVVEELLQLLVGEVDAQLFKGVVLQERKKEVVVKANTTRISSHERSHARTHAHSVPATTLKISKPAMSRTPMKDDFLSFVSNVLLTRVTSQVNILSYKALDSAPMEYTTCAMFLPFWTYSFLTRILGFSRNFMKSVALIPNKWDTFSASVWQGREEREAGWRNPPT